MRTVTKEEFYATVGQMNVHPRPERHQTLWIDQRNMRTVVGVSTPGYLCEGEETYKTNVTLKGKE